MIECPSILAGVAAGQSAEACAHWRVFRPFALLERAGYKVAWARRNDPLTPELAERYQAFLWPRDIYSPLPDKRVRAAAMMARVHAQGRIAIYELDDDLLSDGYAERLRSLHGVSREEAAEAADAGRWTVAQYDGVTVSTEALAEVVRRYTDKPVIVVPNAIDLDWFRAVQRGAKRKVPPLTIGWQGGMRPDSDVSLMADACGRLAKRYPRVRFVVQGFVPECIKRKDLGGRLVTLPWLPIDRYPEGLVNVDVGCCPISDTGWNASKSPIKAFEWAANGSAVVASPLLYGDVIESGRDGYIARTVDDWDQALSRLVESRPLRERMASRLLAKVEREHSLSVNLENWPRAWQAIWRSTRREVRV